MKKKEIVEYLEKELHSHKSDVLDSNDRYVKMSEVTNAVVKLFALPVVRRRCFSCDSLDIQHFETYSECRKCKSIMQ